MSCVSLLSPLALLPPNTNTKPEESNCAYYSRADPVAHADAHTQSSPTEFGACYQKLASFFAGEASHILQNSACLRADLSSSMCLPLSLPHSSFSNSSVPCVCLALLSPALSSPVCTLPPLTPLHSSLPSPLSTLFCGAQASGRSRTQWKQSVGAKARQPRHQHTRSVQTRAEILLKSPVL